MSLAEWVQALSGGVKLSRDSLSKCLEFESSWCVLGSRELGGLIRWGWEVITGDISGPWCHLQSLEAIAVQSRSPVGREARAAGWPPVSPAQCVCLASLPLFQGQPSHGNLISLSLLLTFFWHPQFLIVFHDLSHVYMLLPSVPSAWQLIFEKSAWAELWNPSGSPDRQCVLFLQAPRVPGPPLTEH